jgi:hypothetical protein
MKNTMMRRVLVVFWMTCLMLILTVGAAFAWEAATHAYIEEHLYKKKDKRTLPSLTTGFTARMLSTSSTTISPRPIWNSRHISIAHHRRIF